MLFSRRRLSLPNLCEICRTMRHYLHVGLTLRHALESTSKKGPRRIREVSARISEHLEKGESLEVALKFEEETFPPLFLSMVVVGEQSGMLTEVFAELEKFYIRQIKLRREFIGRITWPIVQFVLATFVLAGMIFILGLIAESRPGTKPFDPLGLGLWGGQGALIFLGTIYGSLAVLTILFFLARRVLRQGLLDELLLRVPALGPCLHALALARFCMALRLTMNTSMPIGQGLRLSLRATGNTAYASRAKAVQQSIRRGDDLVRALTDVRLFPEVFLTALAVGEESGQVPEVMRRLGDEYHDEAGRRLTALSAVAAYAVWLLVAALIVTAIFRIALTYISLLNPPK